MESSYDKLLPNPTSLTKTFWDYCKKHELRMQYCKKCNEWIWYPKAWCPSCGLTDVEWKSLSGKGNLYSFTIIRQVIDNSPSFQKDIPFLIGLVELDEGPRIYSNIQEPVERASIGQRVEVYFEDVTSEYSLPKFKPV